MATNRHFSDESRQLPQLAWTSLLSLDNNTLLFNEPRNYESPRGVIVNCARFQQPESNFVSDFSPSLFTQDLRVSEFGCLTLFQLYSVSLGGIAVVNTCSEVLLLEQDCPHYFCCAIFSFLLQFYRFQNEKKGRCC